MLVLETSRESCDVVVGGRSAICFGSASDHLHYNCESRRKLLCGSRLFIMWPSTTPPIFLTSFQHDSFSDQVSLALSTRQYCRVYTPLVEPFTPLRAFTCTEQFQASKTPQTSSGPLISFSLFPQHSTQSLLQNIYSTDI